MGGNAWATTGGRRDLVRRYGPGVLVAALLVILVLVVAAVMRPAPANPTRPVLLSSADWAPYVGRDLPEGGPLARLVTEVLQHQGYAPTIRFTTWTLAQQQAGTGETVAVFPLVESAARRDRFLLSDPLLDFSYVLFYAKGNPPKINSAGDLAGLRVGRIAGYDYWDALDSAIDGHYVEFDTSLEAFQALAEHKIDVLPEGLLPGQAVLADADFVYDSADFDYVRGDDPALHAEQALRLMVPRTADGQRLLDSFNAGLAAIRQTDDYAAIVGGIGAATAADVTLIPDGSGLVTVRDDSGRVKLRAPEGTRARVLAWPKDLTPQSRVKIKMLNGPAAGRVGFVAARQIRM